MKKIALSIALVVATTLLFAQQLPIDERLKDLDQELEKVLNTWQAAGFAVAVVEKDKIVYEKGFGYRDYENKLPVTPNTLFAIGSCSKAFTSALLGVLRRKDQLSFDDSPIEYIPELRFYNDEMNNQIIIKDLMSHRTGLARHDPSWYFFPSSSSDSLLLKLAYQEPFAGVRETWYYNNYMFLLQGVIAERLTGESWATNIRKHFFEPLDMTTSNLSIAELEQSKEAAFGYELKPDNSIKKMDYYKIAGMRPAGSINSSVHEMSNWLKMWIAGGKLDTVEIIPSNYASEAISAQSIVDSALPDKEHPDLHFANYGYGWFLSSYKGHYRVEHGGNIDGFSANTSFFPSDSIGIVVLVNQNGSSVPSVIRNIIADRMLNVAQTDWNTELKTKREEAMKVQEEAQAASSESNQKKNTKPSHNLIEYTGSYHHPGYGTFEIVLEKDSLFAVLPIEKVWLKHYHYDVFETYTVENGVVDTTDNERVLFNFHANSTGDISYVAVPLEPTVDAIEFERTPALLNLETADLKRYVGEYELMGITAQVYLKKDVLFVEVPGQTAYHLLPVGASTFVLKGLEGYKLEFREADGEVTTAVFQQPNGTFEAKRK